MVRSRWFIGAVAAIVLVVSSALVSMSLFQGCDSGGGTLERVKKTYQAFLDEGDSGRRYGGKNNRCKDALYECKRYLSRDDKGDPYRDRVEEIVKYLESAQRGVSVRIVPVELSEGAYLDAVTGRYRMRYDIWYNGARKFKGKDIQVTDTVKLTGEQAMPFDLTWKPFDVIEVKVIVDDNEESGYGYSRFMGEERLVGLEDGRNEIEVPNADGKFVFNAKVEGEIAPWVDPEDLP